MEAVGTTGAAFVGAAALQQSRFRIKKIRIRGQKPKLKWSPSTVVKVRYRGTAHVDNIFSNVGKVPAMSASIRIDGPNEIELSERLVGTNIIPRGDIRSLPVTFKDKGMKEGTNYNISLTLLVKNLKPVTKVVSVSAAPLRLGLVGGLGLKSWFSDHGFNFGLFRGLNKMDSYNSIIISAQNLKSYSDCERLKSFVNAGKGLVIYSGSFSKLPEDVSKGLADFVGLESVAYAVIDAGFGVKVLDTSHPVTAKWVAGDILRLPQHSGTPLLGDAKQVRVLAHQLVQIKGRPDHLVVPAITAMEIGKGRVVYFNFDIGQPIGLVSYLLERAILWTSGFE
jgi:hypothetical protein